MAATIKHGGERLLHPSSQGDLQRHHTFEEQTLIGTSNTKMRWPQFLTDLNLPNTGSTARDHLANERTYLAWLRTSLSVAAFGIAIEQLVGTTSARITGYIFIILGLIFLVAAIFRYFRIMKLLTQERFEASRISIIILSMLSGVAIGIALYAAIAN